MMKNIKMYEELYGSHVKMDDRFETVHIWSKNLALANNGRWIPIKITEEEYNNEINESKFRY